MSGDSQLPGVPPHGGTGSGNSPQAWDQAFQPGTWESVATIQADVGGQYARGVTTEARRSAKTFGKQVGKKKNGQVTVPTLDGAGATTFELQSIPPNRAVRSLNADDLGVVRTMVGRLRALQNQARQPKTQQRAGRLDRTRLTAAVKGDTRVFRKPGGLGRGKSRAWSVVLDASVSMGGLAHKVRQATGIIGETLHTVNDPFEITEFGGQNEVIGVNKTFDEPWSPGQAYAYNPYGNTYYTDALTRAAYSLSGRDEEAKIMFFITDGGPSEEYDEIRKNVVEPIRRQGIILIPVFLGPAQSAQSIYDEIFGSRQWIAVPNLQNLPRLVYEYLEKYFVTD